MNTKNYSTLTKRYKLALSTIHTIYRLINSSWGLREFLLKAAYLIVQIFEAQRCKIILFDQSKYKISLEFSVDKSGSKNISEVERDKEHMDETELKPLQGEVVLRKNLIAVPLFLEDIIGAILIKGSKERSFDVMDQEILMTLSEQLVMGIKNFQLYEVQEKVIFETINSLVSALEQQGTVPKQRHLRYFSDIALAIVEELGNVKEDEAQAIRYAGMLHSMCMFHIPSEIINKAEKLSDEDMSIVKEHPKRGIEIIKNLNILEPCIPILLHHHERYDGTGYPSGLKGKQIPLGARILSVLDAFEAMVFDRPYKDKMMVEDAKKELIAKKNTQFDPEVVDAFLRALEREHVRELLQQEGIKF